MHEVKKVILGLISISILLVGWQEMAEYLDDPKFPSVVKVFTSLYQSFVESEPNLGTKMHENIIASLSRVFYALFLALIVAVPVGLGMGVSPDLDSLLSPIIEFIRPIPPIAWIPLALVYFRTPMDSIFIVWLGVFFPVLINTISGVHEIDGILIDAARTLGCSKFQLFRKVIFPAVIPSILTGIKVGIGVGWMCIMAAEMMSTSRAGGVGYYIMVASSYSRFDKIFAGMIVVGVVGLIMTKGIVVFGSWFRRKLGYA